jgi:hypothetical protein
MTRTRGTGVQFDALLGLSGAVLVLIPVVAGLSHAAAPGDLDTLYPTVCSVGGVSGLLAWDLWSEWSGAHHRAP